MKYKEQLKHPYWQRKRLEILERDNFMCCICMDTKKTLHVHHKIYKENRKVWEYEDNELITLCEDCHNKIHSNNVEKQTPKKNNKQEKENPLSDVFRGFYPDKTMYYTLLKSKPLIGRGDTLILHVENKIQAKEILYRKDEIIDAWNESTITKDKVNDLMPWVV